MKKIIGMLIGMLLMVCSNNNQNQSSNTGKLLDTTKIEIEKNGIIDPIANINAKKGGTYTTWGSSFPKSLNMFLDYNSFSGEICGFLFEGLVSLHSTTNEPVGILAKEWSVSKDKKTFTFKIHPNATWSDGKPITAEDVQYYYDVIMNKKNMTSIFRVTLKRFKRPKIIDKKTIEITATTTHWKNFWDACGFMALPKHIWKNKNFNKQNFNFPVVSGPYKLKIVKKNRYILLERRVDWWGKVKKYNQNKYNFDYLKYKFMEDRNKALEAFKKGDFDAYPIYTSSIWAKKTDFEQIKNGYVVKQNVYNYEPKGFQGFAINLRKDKFKNILVRKALCYLLNRELMNKKLMYSEYFLLNSYYPDLYKNNMSKDIPLIKYNPKKARELLKKAGYIVGKDGFLYKNNKKLQITFLTYSADQRHLNIYLQDLKNVGISANIEKLSLSSIRKRMDNHNFDLFWSAWGASRLRDPEAMWHSSTANQIASNNYAGVKDSIIDSLIELQKTEMSLDKRNNILKQIDKRLNEIVPYVLLWQADHNRILYWNKFGTTKNIFDKYNREDAIPVYWWYDVKKENILKQAMQKNEKLPVLSGKVYYK